MYFLDLLKKCGDLLRRLRLLIVILFYACGFIQIVNVTHAVTLKSDKILFKAKTLHDQGVLLEAAINYKEYLNLCPDDLETRWILIELLQKLRRYDEIPEHIEFIKSKTPKDPRLLQIKLPQSAQKAQEKVNYNEVKAREYEASITNGTITPDMLIEYGRYLTSTNKLQRSIEVYSLYLSVRERDDQARLELARLYSWTKQYDAGRRECQKLIFKDPKNSDVYSVLGDIEHWSGNDIKSLAAYRHGAKLAKNPTELHTKINRLLQTPGMHELDLYTRAKADPTGKIGMELVERLIEQNQDDLADSLVRVRLSYTSLDPQAIQFDSLLKVRRNDRIFSEFVKTRQQYLNDPNNPEVLLYYAQLMAQYPDSVVIASRIYEQYLAKRPNDYQAQSDYVHTLLWAGKFNAAEKYLLFMNSLYPESLNVQLDLAEALLRTQHDIKLAEKIYRKANEIDPEDQTVLLRLGESIRLQGRYSEAREIYNQILEADSSNKWVPFILSYMTEDFGPLIKNAEDRLKDDPDDTTALSDLAAGLVKAKLYVEAEQAYRRLVKLNPDDGVAANSLHQLERRKRGWQYNEYNTTRTNLENNPENIDARLQLANFLCGQEDYAGAIEQYQIGLSMKPNDPTLTLALASVYLLDHQYEQALAIYKKMVEAYPTNYEYRFRYAETMSQFDNDDATIMEYEKAIALKPDATECLLNIAEMYYQNGEIARAVSAYNNILRQYPDYLPATQALHDIKGSTIRSTTSSNQFTENNEHLGERIYKGSIELGLSMIHKYRIEFGVNSIRQNSKVEEGKFISAATDLKIVSNLWNYSTVSLYSWRNRAAFNGSTEIAFETSRSIGLNSLKLSIYGSARDGYFEVGSTDSLRTLKSKLVACTAGSHVKLTKSIVSVEGDYSYCDLSDKNHRDQMWGELGVDLFSWLTIGGRRESIRFIQPSTDYWAIREYDTYSGVLTVAGYSDRFDYSIRSLYGAVLHTSSVERSCDVECEYRFGSTVAVSLNYIYSESLHNTEIYIARTASANIRLNW